jgi:hypothetical protein
MIARKALSGLRREPPRDFMFTCGSRSNQQHPFGVIRRFDSDMFHPFFPIAPQKVIANTIQIKVNNRFQTFAQRRKLDRIHQAFKNGILDPLPVIQTPLGHPAQPL